MTESRNSGSNIRLSFILPPAVESLRKGWEVTCHSASIITSLFSVVSTIILVFLKSQDDRLKEASPRGHTLLLLAAYGAVVFNTSATVGSLALTDKLAELPTAASQNPDLENSGTTDASPTELLKRFGAGTAWSYVVWHWIFCFFVGVWCMMLEILVFIFLEESLVVKIAIPCVVFFGMMPLLTFIIPAQISQINKS